MEAAGTIAASGERKEHILESSRSQRGSRAKLIERARTANSPVGEQHESVAHALGISQLMNGEHEPPSTGCRTANKAHDVAGLPEIETVERLVHQEERMRREQRQRQHQAARVSFGQGEDPLA